MPRRTRYFAIAELRAGGLARFRLSCPEGPHPTLKFTPEALLTNDEIAQIDQTWNAFWFGGVSNSLSVIEQITYLNIQYPNADLDAPPDTFQLKRIWRGLVSMSANDPKRTLIAACRSHKMNWLAPRLHAERRSL